MILNMNEPKDAIYFNSLQKGKGIKLISKYLPHLLVHKQVYAINTIEEWNQIKDKLPEIVTIRTDNRDGMPIPKVEAVTRVKDKVEEYFIEAMKVEKEPSFLCMELEEGAAEKVDSAGGFLIDATIGGNVYLGYTGPCFGCSDLARGKAEHETWIIPWNDISFVKATNHRKWHVQTISQEAYRDTAIERMTHLIKEYPERKSEIIEKMPKKYSPIAPCFIEKLIDQVLIPLYNQKRELLRDGLESFDVELKVLKNGRLVPMEICRPERFIIKKRGNKEGKEDETR